MTDTRTEHKRRQALSDHEAMTDAQAGCVPCKLCGGKAVITDAGLGAGYYVRCENSGRFRAASGCMIEDRRLGGWAYNVMDWWNRLHSASLPAASEGEKVDEARVVLERALVGSPKYLRARVNTAIALLTRARQIGGAA